MRKWDVAPKLQFCTVAVCKRLRVTLLQNSTLTGLCVNKMFAESPCESLLHGDKKGNRWIDKWIVPSLLCYVLKTKGNRHIFSYSCQFFFIISAWKTLNDRCPNARRFVAAPMRNICQVSVWKRLNGQLQTSKGSNSAASPCEWGSSRTDWQSESVEWRGSQSKRSSWGMFLHCVWQESWDQHKATKALTWKMTPHVNIQAAILGTLKTYFIVTSHLWALNSGQKFRLPIKPR